MTEISIDPVKYPVKSFAFSKRKAKNNTRFAREARENAFK